MSTTARTRNGRTGAAITAPPCNERGRVIFSADGRHHALVSAADYERFAKERWTVNRGYFRSKLGIMHRLVLGLEKGSPFVGDHINHKRHDNRRCNLRAVTPAENARNRTRRPPPIRGHRLPGQRLKCGGWNPPCPPPGPKRNSRQSSAHAAGGQSNAK